MRKEYIAVFDSGIGGISVLDRLVKQYSDNDFIYFGDNNNAPYGNKDVAELLSLTRRNIDAVSENGIKCIVLACNTLSVAVADELGKYYSVPVFGVKPPVLCGASSANSVLFATVKTAEIYRKLLNIGNGTEIIALPNLATAVERNAFNLSAVKLSEHISAETLYKKFTTVILGCTHYNLIEELFKKAYPQSLIVSGIDETLEKIGLFLAKKQQPARSNRPRIVFRGDSAAFNCRFYKMFSRCESKI